MDLKTITLIYFICGITYVLINGTIRKIYSEDEDMFLAFVHVILWWLFVGGALIYFGGKKLKKLRSEYKAKRLNRLEESSTSNS